MIYEPVIINNLRRLAGVSEAGVPQPKSWANAKPSRKFCDPHVLCGGRRPVGVNEAGAGLKHKLSGVKTRKRNPHTEVIAE